LNTNDSGTLQKSCAGRQMGCPAQVHYTPLNVVEFQNCLRETNVTPQWRDILQAEK